MATRSTKLDPVTTRSERAVCDSIYAWSIKTQERVNMRSPASLSEKMTHATQISLALFPDRAYKQQRTFERYSFGLNCLGQCDKCYETATVVSDSGRE